jgi:hypothetical protein
VQLFFISIPGFSQCQPNREYYIRADLELQSLSLPAILAQKNPRNLQTMNFFKNAVQKRPTLFKRLNAPYRVVFIDDESLEEVASFNLTKSKMYMFFSTLFVLTVTITVIILLFTPLKYYIPGYGNDKTHSEVVKLKRNIDSLADLVNAQQAYAKDIKKVIGGDFDGLKDTAMLDMNKVNRDAMKNILPPAEVIKQQEIQSVGKEQKKK